MTIPAKQQTLIRPNSICYGQVPSPYKVKQANAIKNGKTQKQPGEKEVKFRFGFDNFCKQQTLLRPNSICYGAVASPYKVKQANAIKNCKTQKQPGEKEVTSRSGLDNFCKQQTLLRPKFDMLK